MPTSLTLDSARSSDGEVVLIAAGEIDLSNIDAFSDALGTACSEAAVSGGMVTVDLRAVEYLDSGAINALAARADSIKLIADPLLMTGLTVSGLAELVAIEPAPPSD